MSKKIAVTSGDQDVEQKPVEAPAAPKALDVVSREFKDKSGYKLKINHLFEAGGSSFFRVNYIPLGAELFKAHWVKVTDGKAEVTDEDNKPFKPEP